MLSSALRNLRLAGSPECASAIAGIGSRRHLPKRGTKPHPQYLWDMDHFEKVTDGQYTHKPLRINRLGGRHPETGLRIDQNVGGGTKFDFFMIDYDRSGPTEPGVFYEERVLEVRRDPNRHPYIALIAGTKGKRWILATINMKAGQIIRSSSHIPANPITAVEGDSHPLGALAAGTLINSVQRFRSAVQPPSTAQFVHEGHFQVFIRDAGASATVVRQQGDYTVIRMPNKHEYALHRECMATVGQLSHPEYHTSKIFGSAQMHRRFGYKMNSGLWHKKDGYLGRKIRPLPAVRTFEKPETAKPPFFGFSLSKDDCSGLQGHARMHNLNHLGFMGKQFPY